MACVSHGPYAPEHGHRFNPAKLLLDPYAKAIDGGVRWEAANTLPYRPGAAGAEDVADGSDDAAAMPRCVVIDPGFDWEDDAPLETPWHETVIYELHVKGFTRLHPAVREHLRGTYAGLASDAAIAHLEVARRHGPRAAAVHHIIEERFIHERGLTNYWGYSSIGDPARMRCIGHHALGLDGDDVGRGHQDRVLDRALARSARTTGSRRSCPRAAGARPRRSSTPEQRDAAGVRAEVGPHPLERPLHPGVARRRGAGRGAPAGCRRSRRRRGARSGVAASSDVRRPGRARRRTGHHAAARSSSTRSMHRRATALWPSSSSSVVDALADLTDGQLAPRVLLRSALSAGALVGRSSQAYQASTSVAGAHRQRQHRRRRG